MPFVPLQPTVANGKVVSGQTLTVTTSSIAFAAFNSQTNVVLVQVNGNNVYATFDGTTASVKGAILFAGNSYHWDTNTARNAKFIQVSATASIFGQEFVTATQFTQMPDVDLLKQAPLSTSGFVSQKGLIRLNGNFGLASATETAITWSAAVYDDAGCWSSGAPTILTVPTTATRMRVQVDYRFDNTATSGSRSIKIKDNAANVWGADEQAASTIADTSGTPSTPWIPVKSLGTTSFTVTATQNSTAAINLAGTTAGGGTMLSYEII